jgi:hypothetical protein
MNTMDLDNLKNQFKGRKFGDLVLHHMKSQSPNDRIKALRGTISLLPELFQTYGIETLIDEINKDISKESFWKTDCSEMFSTIIEITRRSYHYYGFTPSNDDLFNAFNIIVLNLAYAAESQPEMEKFIKRSVNSGFFSFFKRK